MAVRHILLALAATVATAPSMAQTMPATDAPVVKAGQVLRDANAVRIGQIDRVSKDGSVQVIYQQRIVTIPASTISVTDGKPMTSMTKKDIGKL